MIRSALIALGLSAGGLGAGTATAQGMVPMAPALQVCGGTRLVLDADDATDIVDLNFAAEIVSRRVGKFYTQPVDFTHLVGEVVPLRVIGQAFQVGAIFGLGCRQSL